MTKEEIKRTVRGIVDNHLTDKSHLSYEEQQFMLEEVFKYWPDGDSNEYIDKYGGVEYMCVKYHYHEASHSSHPAIALKLRLKNDIEVWSWISCLRNRPRPQKNSD